MVVSRTDARDRILAPLKTVVDAQTLYAIWDDTSKSVPNDSQEWVRITVKHRSGTRTSLGRQDGKRRHTLAGFVFVEIFTPREDGLARSDELSAAFASAFKSATSSDIWYRDVAETEVGEDGDWFRSDVIAEFEYDLIQ